MLERENDDQNMPMIVPYLTPFLTSLAPTASPESELSIGAKLVKSIFIFTPIVAHHHYA